MGRWMRAEKEDEAGMGRQRGFMCHSEPSLTSAGPKSEWRDVEDIRGGGWVWGCGAGASEGLEIVGVFQRRTPRKASISSGVRMAPPPASRGASTPQFRLKTSLINRQ